LVISWLRSSMILLRVCIAASGVRLTPYMEAGGRQGNRARVDSGPPPAQD
jgi:hypothetical protein